MTYLNYYWHLQNVVVIVDEVLVDVEPMESVAPGRFRMPIVNGELGYYHFDQFVIAVANITGAPIVTKAHLMRTRRCWLMNYSSSRTE